MSRDLSKNRIKNDYVPSVAFNSYTQCESLMTCYDISNNSILANEATDIS